jgi:hypothetical protein
MNQNNEEYRPMTFKIKSQKVVQEDLRRLIKRQQLDVTLEEALATFPIGNESPFFREK